MKQIKKTVACVATMSILATGVPMSVTQVQAETIEGIVQSNTKGNIPEGSTLRSLFPDEGTALMVAEKLGLVNHAEVEIVDFDSPVTQEELDEITYLDNNSFMDRYYISDLSGIEYLHNLERLSIVPDTMWGSFDLKDVTPLKNLKRLRELEIYHCNIEDISPLQNLTNLEVLDLRGNKVVDVNPLAYLTNLTDLNLGQNKVADLSPLVNLINLEEMDVSGSFTDMRVLKDLPIVQDPNGKWSLYGSVDLEDAYIGEEVPFVTYDPFGNKNMDDPSMSIDGRSGGEYKDGKLIWNKPGKGRAHFEFPDKRVHTWVYQTVIGQLVSVVYEDEEGDQIAEPTILEGKEGETYESKAKEIKGYILKETPTNASGVFTSEAQTVRYVYRKTVEGAPVTVVYEDENGKELAPSEELKGKEGETFKSKAKEIEGYMLKETPTNASGVFTSEAQTVRYVYKNAVEGAPVTVVYEDENGKELAPSEALKGKEGEAYTSKAKEIKGYTLKETPTNANGVFTSEAQTVRYVYTKEEKVSIPDPKLRKGIASRLGISEEEITKTAMQGLTRLDVSYDGVQSLEGLQYAGNLEVLGLSSNKISDLSPLSELTRLYSLSLNKNEISNLSPLAGVTNLQELFISENKISDVSPLSGLTKLWFLSLSKNEISDVNPFSSGFIKLRELYLDENKISNVSPLLSLKNLQLLDLSKSQISDWSPLSGFTNLNSLGLAENKINDVSSLSKLTNLTSLNLTKNKISDVSPLSKLTLLESLNLTENEISDVNLLSGLTNLTSLNLTKNEISDVNPLSELIRLNYLTLTENKISDIGPLSKLTRLIDLNIDSNEISDVSPLIPLSKINLRDLRLSKNKISDASPMSRFTRVGYLDLREQKIVLQESSSPTKIKIRDKKGKVPALESITGGGFEYDEETNLLKWTQVGQNSLSFRSADYGFSGTITQSIDVAIGKKPEIHAEDQTIKVGAEFDPKAGVTATDKEDGDLTAKVEVTENDVDTEKAGTYHVTYVVTDSDGNKTEKTIIVTVRTNEKPEIQAGDRTIKVGAEFDSKAGVTATDKEDGDVTNKIEVTENDVDTEKVGTYHVTYVVTDSDGNKTEKTITVTVEEMGDYGISVNDYNVDSDTFVSGTVGKDVQTVTIEVNGLVVNHVTPKAGAFTAYVRGYVNSVKDEVVVTSKDAEGNTKEKVKVALLENHAEVTASDYNLERAYITGTVDPKATKVVLYVDGVAVRNSQLNSENHTYKVYAHEVTSTTQKVEVVASKGKSELKRVKVNVQEAPEYSLTADNHKLGDTFITGTVDPKVTKVVLYVDGVAVRNSQLDSENHTYKVYASDVTSATQKVEVVASKQTSEVKRVEVKVK